MNDNAIKEFFAKEFEAKDFFVKILLPEPKEGVRTADLHLEDPENNYFIEIVRKLDDETELRTLKDDLSKNVVVTRVKTARATNRMSGIVKEETKQLEVAAGRTDFRIILFVACGITPEMAIQQFVSTLYGEENLFDVFNPNDNLPCFYFSFNEFYPLRDKLDGAIVGGTEGAIFYLNNLSHRANALRNSRLYKMFGKAVCDPQKMEADGRAYIADCDADRKDKFGVLEYVRKKYGKPKLMFFHESQQAVHMTVIPVEGKNDRDASASMTI